VKVLKLLGVLTLALAAGAGCSNENAAETSPPPAAAAVQGGPTVNLPKAAGPWTRPEEPRRIIADTIFDYMDGGGELYLAYRFDHLDVYEYKAADPSLGTILVEIYQMQSSDDAFGLLSGDWGGEAVAIAPEARPASGGPFPRALYGAGLLRLWAGDLYARILASRESPAAREQVLALGRVIAAARPPAAVPNLVARHNTSLADSDTGRPDALVFFRSHLVLNSAYFLASEDILGLGRDVDAVTRVYRPLPGDKRRIRLIVVRYPGAERATAALRTFKGAYLPELASDGRDEGAAQTEGGWVAFRRKGASVAIVLDAGTRDQALEMVRPQLD
jgi:hypothetical protein